MTAKKQTKKRTRVTASKTTKKPTERKVLTTYYFGEELVKQNRSLFANRAVPKCVDHMQFNTYGATHAEVYDEETGELHASIYRPIVTKGEQAVIEVWFAREIKETYTATKHRGGAKISRKG